MLYLRPSHLILTTTYKVSVNVFLPLADNQSLFKRRWDRSKMATCYLLLFCIKSGHYFPFRWIQAEPMTYSDQQKLHRANSMLRPCSGSFSLRTLEIQLPCGKEVQAMLLETRITWRGRHQRERTEPCGGGFRPTISTQAPAMWKRPA